MILEEGFEALDEIVVIGYGTQKKVNLTGSVSSISSKKLTNRPAANTSELLMGQISEPEMVGALQWAQLMNEGGMMQMLIKSHH